MTLNKKWSLILAGASLVSAASLLQACGGEDIDCNNSENVGSYNEGKKLGTAQGNTAGSAPTLNYEHGKRDGYPIGRSEGYNAGYYSPNGLNAGKAAGVKDGRIQGANDVYSCSNGTTDGAADGYADGFSIGNEDGYYDGYEDGYLAGMPVGQYSCSAINGSTADNQNTCKARGYSESYQAAYNAAKAANSEYQRGVNDGKGQGYADGFNPGASDGYRDGYAAGKLQGLSEGQQVAYSNCYNQAYENGQQDAFGTISGGKTLGYNDGYNDPNAGYGRRPTPPSFSNGTGGAGDGFYDGYLDGRSLSCGDASKPAQYTPMSEQRFGYGTAELLAKKQHLPWFYMKGEMLVRGTRGDHTSKYMNKEQASALAAKLKAKRETLHDINRANIAF